MLIGEIAESAGLPSQTIRFYEREGLLPPARRGANGYRVYGETTLNRLDFIRAAQSAGLTLAEIRSRLLDVLRAYPGTAGPLLDYHEALMRGPSPLTVAERELVAAYVSGLNSCDYCYGIHSATAQRFGVDDKTLTAMPEGLDTAGIDDRMRPLLRYVGKLTSSPGRVSPADAVVVLDAGWDEQALHDAVSVCALFNFMNRFVNGLGISADAHYSALSGERLADGGYAGLKKLMWAPAPQQRSPGSAAVAPPHPVAG